MTQQLHTVLVGTDMSDASTGAVWQAAHLARRTGAVLVLAHIASPTQDEARLDQRAAPDAGELARALTERGREAEALLADIERQIAQGGLRVQRRIERGHPVDGLCDLVGTLGADMLVLGTHGRTGAKRVLLGSVAERAARQSPASTLVARGDAGAGGYRRILVATDFETPADAAFAGALALAADTAQVDVVHCFAVPGFAAGGSGEWSASLYREIEASERVRADRSGASVISQYSRDGVTARFDAIASPPIDGILGRLHDAPAPYDLLAVGTHGRRGLRRFLLGSVAEATIRYAPCSVLVAR